MEIFHGESENAEMLKRNYCHSSSNFSKMHMAAIKGDVTEIVQLIDEGYDVNAVIDYAGVTKGFTPLHLAADFKNTNAVEVLLENGADFSLEDANSRTALHFACRKQAKDIIELIVKAYLTVCSRLNENVRRVFEERKIPTDLDVKISDNFRLNFKPLHFAVKFRLTEILMTLIECGVDVMEINSNGMTALHSLVAEYSCLIEEDMRDCRIILHNVVKKFVKDRICPSSLDRIIGKLTHLLVSSYRDIKDTADYFGRTPMFYLYDGLCYTKSLHYLWPNRGVTRWRFNSAIQGWERLNMVRRVLRWPCVNMRVRDYKGNTILHALAQVIFPDQHDESAVEINFLIKEYLASGGDIDAINNEGFTPLQLNCQANNVEIAEALLQYGADINLMDRFGDTAYSILRQIRRKWPTRRWDLYSFTMFSYLKRLVILGAPVCDLNMTIYEYDNFMFETQRELREAGKRIVFDDEVYRDELECMRNKKVDAYTTLYDILWKDVKNLVHHASNATLLQTSFLKDYPLYGYLVRNKLNDAKARAKLLEPAREILKWIIPVVLPEHCLDNILTNFINYELIELRRIAEFKGNEEE